MSQFVSITLVIILGMFLNSCGQMTAEDEGMSSKSIKESSGTTTTTLASTVISELRASLSSTSSSRQARVSSRSTSKTLSNSLTSTQITSVVDAATTAVTASSLDSSEDLIQIMPKIIEGSQGKLATVGLSNSFEAIEVINVIGNSLVKSINGRSDKLPSASAESGSTANETVLSKITSTSVANLDEAGLSSTDIGNASSQLVETVVGSLGSGGLTSSELGGALDKITAGAVDSLDQITGFSVSSLGDAIDNITSGATAALGDITVTGYSADDLTTMVEKVTSGATSALGNIYMTGYSSDNLSSMVEKVTSGATSALGKIEMTGYDSTKLTSMVEKVTAGATGALGKISMTGYDATDLTGMMEKVTSGATSALGRISMTGYSSDNLSSMVEKVTSGATSAMGSIEMTGFSSDNLASMVEKVTAGATGALGKIEMTGYDAADLSGMMEKVTAGATGALGKISMTGYDASDLTGMMEKVTAGATGALGDISMTGYSSDNLSSMVEKVTSGATGALGNIVMDGYSSDNLSSMVEKVTAGATGALGKIEMTGYDSADLSGMLTKISAGATGALGEIEMDGYDSDDLSGMVSKITSGATGALGKIEMTGYSSDNITSMTSTIADATTNSLGDITMTGYDPNTDNLSSSVTTGSNAGLLLQPPMVKEITAVTTPTKDNTPSYTFKSSKAGTITYGGNCSSSTTSATADNNTITFTALSDGTYSNCSIYVTSSTGVKGNALSVTPFTVDTTAPTANFTAATDNVGTVTGALTSGNTTDDTVLVLSGTNESGSSVKVFNGSTELGAATVSGTSWSYSATVANGTTYQFNVKETDLAGNTSDATSNFVVTGDTTAPTASVTTATITNSGGAVVQSTETGTAYMVKTTVSVSNLASITGAADNLWNSVAITSANTNTNLVATGFLNGTYKVYAVDAAGNLSSASSASVVVNATGTDTTAPSLSEVTAVPTQTGDNTPSYTFSSNEAGTITYGGSCSSSDTSATSGNNTITFNALADGTYDNCMISVTDSSSNTSDNLSVSSFTIGATKPALAQVTAVPTPTNDNTSSYTFNSTLSGTISYGGSCSSSTTSAVAGNNTIIFNALAEGTYSNCTISVTSSGGVASDNLSVSSFTIDITAPTLSQVTAVTTPTSDTTPEYSFSSTEAGTNSYGGSCGSSSTSVTSSGLDNVTIILTQPDDSTALSGNTVYSNCTITVTDSAGNTSTPLSVNTFVVDTTAPTVSSTSPTDGQSGVSISANISVTFSEAMNTNSVTTNTSNTTCSGSFQLSSDNFSGCVQMSSSPTSSNSYKTFTVDPSDNFSHATTYKIRVTTGVSDSAGNVLSSQYTQTDGFKTTITIPTTAGSEYSCFMLDNGSVKCWGRNNLGQLGLGDTSNRGDNSSEMGDNLTVIDLGSGRIATAIEAGNHHTCALLDNASIKCWGSNASGQLGLGDTNNRGDGSNEMGDNLPTVDLGSGRTATAIASGDSHTCVVIDNASIKCWGKNESGQLGLGDTDNRGDGSGEMGDNLPSVDLGTGRTAKVIAAGSSHTCAVLDNSLVKCWGENPYGQLGLGDTSTRGDGSGEMGDNLATVDLGSGRTATSITTGGGYTCVLLDDDSVKCWGRGNFGQMGTGEAFDVTSPNNAIDLGTGRTATAIAAGNNHTCAILDNSSIKCWGLNNSGQLGIGDTSTRGDGSGEMGDNLATVDLGSGRTAKAISVGDGHTCVVFDNAVVKCWGLNNFGQLGLGDTDNRGDGSNEMGDNLPLTYIISWQGTQQTIVISRTGTAWNGSTYTSSNLEWQIATGGVDIWDNAISYCDDLELASKTDWRLPTRDELASLIDMRDFVARPKIVSSLISSTADQPFWSSSISPSASYDAGIVHFGSGGLDYHGKTLNYSFRCVRT